MSKFSFDVIDDQAHLGFLPGHLSYYYSAEDLVGCLDAERVRYALTSSASATTIGQSHGNREMLDAVERYPDRLGMLIWINPRGPEWLRDAEQAADRGALGIKLHPKLDNYHVDYDSLREVFEFARRRQLPICTHAETGDWSAEHYVPLVEKFDDVDLILYHFNAGRPIAGILVAKRFPRVYVDTCFVPREAIEAGLDIIGPSKILFGTDVPLYFDIGRSLPWGNERRRTFHDCTRDIEELASNAADRDLILAGNARRIFRLKV